jgi:hypothetical protein
MRIASNGQTGEMTSDPPKPPGQPPDEPDPDDPPPIEEPPIPIPVPPIEPPPEPLRAELRQLLRSQSRGLCRARSLLLVERPPLTQSRPPWELVDGSCSCCTAGGSRAAGEGALGAAQGRVAGKVTLPARYRGRGLTQCGRFARGEVRESEPRHLTELLRLEQQHEDAEKGDDQG